MNPEDFIDAESERIAKSHHVPEDIYGGQTAYNIEQALRRAVVHGLRMADGAGPEEYKGIVACLCEEERHRKCEPSFNAALSAKSVAIRDLIAKTEKI